MSKLSSDDVQVLIPYKTLESLLQASAEIKHLRLDIKRLSEQQSALRLQFIELMELYNDLRL